jgi:hypothetical protein
MAGLSHTLQSTGRPDLQVGRARITLLLVRHTPDAKMGVPHITRLLVSNTPDLKVGLLAVLTQD